MHDPQAWRDSTRSFSKQSSAEGLHLIPLKSAREWRGFGWLCTTAASLRELKGGSEVFFSPDVEGVTGVENVKKQYRILEYVRRKHGV